MNQPPPTETQTMSFKFEIQEVYPIPIRENMACLYGNVLEGELRLHTFIQIPLAPNGIGYGVIYDIGANNRKLEVITAGAEHVSIAVSLRRGRRENIQLGIATEWVRPPADSDESPTIQSTPPVEKQSGWGAFWHLLSVVARIIRRGNQPPARS